MQSTTVGSVPRRKVDARTRAFIELIRHFANQLDKERCAKGLLVLFSSNSGVEFTEESEDSGSWIVSSVPDDPPAGSCYGNVMRGDRVTSIRQLPAGDKVTYVKLSELKDMTTRTKLGTLQDSRNFPLLFTLERAPLQPPRPAQKKRR
jgi:hypothetical protein